MDWQDIVVAPIVAVAWLLSQVFGLFFKWAGGDWLSGIHFF